MRQDTLSSEINKSLDYLECEDAQTMEYASSDFQ